MKQLSKSKMELPIWKISILVSLVSIIFFIYITFQVNLFPEEGVKKVYYVDNISSAHQKIIDKFNKIYSEEIEVIPVNLPFSFFTTNDRKSILTRSLRNRSDGVDIFAVDIIWVSRFAKWGYTIEPYIEPSMMNDVNEIALKACYQRDSLLAFPLFLDMGVMYYRQDIIRGLPNGKEIEKKIQRSLTWEEFISLGKKFKSTNYPYYIFPGGEFEGMLCCFQEMLSVEESVDLYYSNPINLNKHAANRSLQQMVDFIYKYKFSPREVIGFDGFKSYVYANENDAVFLRGWVGYHKHHRGALNDTSKIKYMKIAPLPHFKDKKTSSVFGGWSLMISKFSDRKEEALKFLKFVFLPENQKILYEEGGYLPINDVVYRDSLFLKKHPELMQIKEMLIWAKHRPFLENYTKISEIMSKSMHKALKNELEVEEALNKATFEINNQRVIIKN